MSKLIRNTLRYREACPPTERKTAVIPRAKEALRTPFGAKSLVMDALMISRNLSTQIITVGTNAVRLIKPPHYYPYLISNPSLTVGLTSSTTLFTGTVSAAGNTQASPLGVANYINAHFHIDITAITGTWDIILQSRDPNSTNWADVQNLFTGLTGIGTQYAYTADLGVAVDLAVRWNPTAAGSMTFSITATLKDGLGGTGSGLARTVFLGNVNVTTDTGYPIFEGQEKIVSLGPEVELYGIAAGSIPVKVFTL